MYKKLILNIFLIISPALKAADATEEQPNLRQKLLFESFRILNENDLNKAEKTRFLQLLKKQRSPKKKQHGGKNKKKRR